MHVWWNGRHVRLRGVWGNPCKFKSCHVHHLKFKSSKELFFNILLGAMDKNRGSNRARELRLESFAKDKVLMYFIVRFARK